MTFCDLPVTARGPTRFSSFHTLCPHSEHIKLKLKQHDLLRIYPRLHVIPVNKQQKGMHTILR